jgi:hypothetical protein
MEPPFLSPLRDTSLGHSTWGSLAAIQAERSGARITSRVPKMQEFILASAPREKLDKAVGGVAAHLRLPQCWGSPMNDTQVGREYPAPLPQDARWELQTISMTLPASRKLTG